MTHWNNNHKTEDYRKCDGDTVIVASADLRGPNAERTFANAPRATAQRTIINKTPIQLQPIIHGNNDAKTITNLF